MVDVPYLVDYTKSDDAPWIWTVEEKGQEVYELFKIECEEQACWVRGHFNLDKPNYLRFKILEYGWV